MERGFQEKCCRMKSTVAVLIVLTCFVILLRQTYQDYEQNIIHKDKIKERNARKGWLNSRREAENCTCQNRRPLIENEIQPKLNATQDAPLVIYNRVPKCGSSSMTWLMNNLQKRLNFHLLDINLPGLKNYGDDAIQAEMVLFLQSLKPSTIFVRHLHFLNFGKFRSKWPIYINIIRDPIERFISHYYYMRNGFSSINGKAELWKSGLSAEKMNQSLDDCLLKNAKACVKSSTPTFLAYFCGQEEKCREYSQYSLDKAKENVKQHYLAIGLVEDWENTLELFQTLLPMYFNGAKRISLSEIAVKTKTRNRLDLAESSRTLLKQELRYEMEFYEFAKKRFYEQLREMKSKQKIL